uniref:Uncharacterized protein n=1 Tax=Eutreptiella gymnastica TaxID=73025 RepID=A0A7S1ISV2_9EUGL
MQLQSLRAQGAKWNFCHHFQRGSLGTRMAKFRAISLSDALKRIFATLYAAPPNLRVLNLFLASLRPSIDTEAAGSNPGKWMVTSMGSVHNFLNVHPMHLKFPFGD